MRAMRTGRILPLLPLLALVAAQCSERPAPRDASVPASGGSTSADAGAPGSAGAGARPDPATQKLDPGLAPAWRAIREGRPAEGRALVAGYLVRAGGGARRGQAEFLLGVSF